MYAQIHSQLQLTSNFMLWLSDMLFWEAIKTDLLFLCAFVYVDKNIKTCCTFKKSETIDSPKNYSKQQKREVKIATIRTDCCMSMCMQNRQICLTLHDSVTFISTMHTIHKHSQFHSIVILLNIAFIFYIWLNLVVGLLYTHIFYVN